MKKIAVVEDEEYMREELCTMLKRAGYDTLEITAFENAVEQILSLIHISLRRGGLRGQEKLLLLRQGLQLCDVEE